jgi:hypothetical protein
MANCRPSIPDFVFSDCVFESGRVVALAFIHKDIHAAIYADPSNASLWADGDYTADLHVFQEVRGSYDGGSPTDVPGVGNQDSRVINNERTLTVAIPGVKGNEEFFNGVSSTFSGAFFTTFVVVFGFRPLFFVDSPLCFPSTPSTFFMYVI